MEAIRTLPPLAPPAAVDPPTRGADAIERGSGGRSLDPAVTVDIGSDDGTSRGADSERRGFERDVDSQAVVYRVTDSLSGDVIIQIPNEIVVKARSYGREQNPPLGEIVERRA